MKLKLSKLEANNLQRLLQTVYLLTTKILIAISLRNRKLRNSFLKRQRQICTQDQHLLRLQSSPLHRNPSIQMYIRNLLLINWNMLNLPPPLKINHIIKTLVPNNSLSLNNSKNLLQVYHWVGLSVPLTMLLPHLQQEQFNRVKRLLLNSQLNHQQRRWVVMHNKEMCAVVVLTIPPLFRLDVPITNHSLNKQALLLIGNRILNGLM